MGLIFEWDARKAASNRKKHGVSFDDASTVFADNLSLTAADPLHSEEEARFVTLGRARSGRLLVVVHADREDRIRLVSARRATPKEHRRYEQGSSI